MNENTTMIISPHFSSNTYLVANLCKMCYSQGDEVSITSINLDFLKKYDPNEYLNFKIPEITQTDEDVMRFYDNSHSIILKSSSSDTSNNFQFSKNILSKYKMEKFTRKKLNNEIQQCVVQERNRIHHNATYYPNVSLSDKNENNLQSHCRRKSTRIIKDTSILKGTEMQSFSTNLHTSPYQMSMKEKERTTMNYISRNTESQLSDKSNQLGTKLSKWVPPISPHNLIEERFYHDPWALLVVTIFLNKTSCRMASPHINNFFQKFKNPYDVLKTDVLNLETYFSKIGLVKTRTIQIWRMSYDFIYKDWKSVKELYGIGKYAEDVYKMFYLGDFNVEPTDRYLKIYKAWYEMTRKHADRIQQ